MNKPKFNQVEYYHSFDGRASEPIYYEVDEEKGIVIARMTDCQYSAMKVLGKLGLELIKNYNLNLNKVMINKDYSGKAKCHPEDDFDLEIGKRIARNRMLKKYYSARTKALAYAQVSLFKINHDLLKNAEFSAQRAISAELGRLQSLN